MGVKRGGGPCSSMCLQEGAILAVGNDANAWMAVPSRVGWGRLISSCHWHVLVMHPTNGRLRLAWKP